VLCGSAPHRAIVERHCQSLRNTETYVLSFGIRTPATRRGRRGVSHYKVASPSISLLCLREHPSWTPLPLSGGRVAGGGGGCAAQHKHGREGLLLRSRACAGLLFAFFYSLLSSRSRPTREGAAAAAPAAGRGLEHGLIRPHRSSRALLSLPSQWMDVRTVRPFVFLSPIRQRRDTLSPGGLCQSRWRGRSFVSVTGSTTQRRPTYKSLRIATRRRAEVLGAGSVSEMREVSNTHLDTHPVTGGQRPPARRADAGGPERGPGCEG